MSIDLTVTPTSPAARASAWISSMTARNDFARSTGAARETGASFDSWSRSPASSFA